ncbi:MAG: SDR family oxidoreductase [Myxococcales bacterium]|nr:SDR family oxidoreductase [Myxococcales bacterium]HRC57083.1 SDR family oxidoreductase [Kofleriaceae bacterium]
MKDLESKTFLITGASSGIGRISALALAARGAHVMLACRSRDKTAAVLEEIGARGGKASYLALDLADLSSVRACAAQVIDEGTPLAGLINNAGLAGARGLTKDGFELAFGTNHLGHYLLTRLLLPHLERHAPARIVNVSSEAHYGAKQIPWDELTRPTKARTGLPEYSVSKLCNVLFTKELARRLATTHVTAFAVHPGVVATEVWREVPAPLRWIIKRFMTRPEQGANSMLAAATLPELTQISGTYLDWNCQPRPPNKLAEDAALALELWQRSAAWVGLPD